MKASRLVMDPLGLNSILRAPAHEFRIYGDDMAQTYALVDEEDYAWLVQWRWFITKECPVQRRKAYMRRTSSRYDGTGNRIGIYSYYMHVEIMQRTGVPPPTPDHTIVGHQDGNGLDCRRSNLIWETPSTNNYSARRGHKRVYNTVETMKHGSAEQVHKLFTRTGPQSAAGPVVDAV